MQGSVMMKGILSSIQNQRRGGSDDLGLLLQVA
jgi:hypothetical protein